MLRCELRCLRWSAWRRSSTSPGTRWWSPRLRRLCLIQGIHIHTRHYSISLYHILSCMWWSILIINVHTVSHKLWVPHPVPDFRHIAKRLLALQEYFDPQQVTQKSISWKFRNVQTLPRFATWSATTPTSSWWTGPTCRGQWTSWRRRWTCQQGGFPSHPPPSRTHLTSIRPDTRFVLATSFERSTHLLSTPFFRN